MNTPPSIRCSGRLLRNRRPSFLQKEKQIDYILTKKRYLRHVKDAEANDIIHMGSDHRCVMATFMITMLGKNSNLTKTKGKHDTKKYERSTQAEKNISIEMPELEKIVDTIKKATATKGNEAHDTMKNAKAQVKRENAAAAEANRTLEEAEVQEIERRSMKRLSKDVRTGGCLHPV